MHLCSCNPNSAIILLATQTHSQNYGQFFFFLLFFCAGQRPCPGSELLPCTSSQQSTLITLIPTFNQALLQDSTKAGCLKQLSDVALPIISSTESMNSITSCQQQNLMHTSSSEDYSYPNLRVQLQEHHIYGTYDGYVIVQPDHSVWQSGPRGAMEDTL